MKFPNDVVSRCSNQGCPNSKEDFLSEEAHALIRKSGGEVVVGVICPDCAKEAEKYGIPVPLVVSLIKREDDAQAIIATNTAELANYDVRQSEIAEIFSAALYLCVAPACTSAPEPATKMFTVEMAGEKFIPICSICTDLARKAGVKVEELHHLNKRLAREARAALLFEREQKRLALVKQFFEQCMKSGQRVPATTSAHQDNGFRGTARMAATNK